MLHGRWQRIYLGKNLDTTKYITANDEIDWEAVKAFRARKCTTLCPRPPTNRLELPYDRISTSPVENHSPQPETP